MCSCRNNLLWRKGILLCFSAIFTKGKKFCGFLFGRRNPSKKGSTLKNGDFGVAGDIKGEKPLTEKERKKMKMKIAELPSLTLYPFSY